MKCPISDIRNAFKMAMNRSSFIQREKKVPLKRFFVLRGGSNTVPAPVAFVSTNASVGRRHKTRNNDDSRDSRVLVIVKTACGIPSLDREWSFTLPEDSTIADVQEILKQKLPDNPPVQILRIVHEFQVVEANVPISHFIKHQHSKSRTALNDSISGEAKLHKKDKETMNTRNKQQKVILILDISVPPVERPDQSGEDLDDFFDMYSDNEARYTPLLAAFNASAATAAALKSELTSRKSYLDGKKLDKPLHAIETIIFGGSKLPLCCSEAFCSNARDLESYMRKAKACEKRWELKHMENTYLYLERSCNIGEYIQELWSAQFDCSLATLAQLAVGSVVIQQLLSHTASPKQSKSERRQQKLREMVVLSAAPAILLFCCRPVLLGARFLWWILPRGKIWQSGRNILPVAHSALLEETFVLRD